MAKAGLTGKITINEDALRRVRERLRGAAKRIHQHKLSVGIHESDAHEEALDYNGKPTGVDVVTEAMIHEFGAHGTPERSWLRSWYDQHLDRLKQEVTKAYRAEYAGEADAIKDLAAKWGQELHDWITTGSANLAPLSLATQEERAKAGLPSGPPLYATGQLVKLIRAMLDAQFVD